MKSKPFSQVKIGDLAYSLHLEFSPTIEPEGSILWKGNIDELIESQWSVHFEEWDMTYSEAKEEKIDFVVVQTKIWGPVLFNYDYDCCGVGCYID